MAVNSVTAMKGRRGQFFDLRLPEANDVWLEDVVHALSNTCRFGGHTREFFSVAQHSVECAMLSIKWDRLGDGSMLPDWKDRAYACLMHDAHEAYVGDIPSPMKSAMGDHYRNFEFPIHEAVMAAMSAGHLIEQYKDHVKRVDYAMLYSDAVRWGMDGIIIDENGEELGAPLEWVPRDAEIYFQDHESLLPRDASEAFYRMFFHLDGMERGVHQYQRMG